MPLDPHAQRFLDWIAAARPPTAPAPSVAERRESLALLLRLAAEPVAVAGIENRTLPGPAGVLPIRIYTPQDADGVAPDAPLPGMLFFHGGGLVAGNLDSHQAICCALSNASGCRLIAVDYRLAPEARFPAALEDGYSALCWLAEHGRQLGLESPRGLIVAGDSAGATLAAVICQQAVAAGVPVALQLLLCPILDHGAVNASRRTFNQGYFLDSSTLEDDLQHYLSPRDDLTDPRISPARATQLRGLPPTCIHTAEFDPLRDEGAAYAQRLQEAGVATTYRCHSGMIHLFYGMGGLIPYAATAYRCIGTDIRSLLA